MGEGSNRAKEILLGDDFGDVAVKVNGVRVEVHTDGSILAYTNGRVDAYTNGPVQGHPAVNDDANPEAPHEIPLRQGYGGQVGAIENGKTKLRHCFESVVNAIKASVNKPVKPQDNWSEESYAEFETYTQQAKGRLRDINYYQYLDMRRSPR